jgi:hypothetical protein
LFESQNKTCLPKLKRKPSLLAKLDSVVVNVVVNVVNVAIVAIVEVVAVVVVGAVVVVVTMLPRIGSLSPNSADW